MKTRTRVALVAGALLAGALAIAACDDNLRSHIYAAAQYQPSAGCMGAYTAVDVVDGDDTGSTCAPVCLANGGVYYVSTMCPPYPALYTVRPADAAAADPICTAALAAYAAGTQCAADGGADADDGGGTDAASESSTNGDGAADGASADAANDVTADATADAAADAPAVD